MKKLYIIFFLCFCFLIIMNSNLHALEKKVYPPTTIDELERSLKNILEEYKIPGMAVVLISHDNIIWEKYFGKANIESNIPVTQDTIFRIGSTTKMFTSIAMLMLQERGLIDLNMKLKDIAPEIKYENPWEATHPVRVVHLLEHTTGFEDIQINEYAHFDPDITLKEALNINPSSRKSRWQPGTFMSYCSSGPPIAAYILEKVTGQRYEDFVQENIFDKLGMETSSFFLSDTVKMYLSRGYPGSISMANLMPGYSEDGAYWHYIMRPSGGLNCRATELAAFIQMLINRGTYNGQKLLMPESVARMERAHTTLAAKQGMPYGYGLGNFSRIHNGFNFQGHDGGLSGFLSSAKYMPEHGLGFVILLNKSELLCLRALENLIAGFITRTLEKAEAPFTKLPEEILKNFTGYYDPVTMWQMLRLITRFAAVRKVTLENGRLFYKPLMGGGAKKELIPVTENRFRTTEQPDATMVFIKEGNDLYWQNVVWPAPLNYIKVSSFLKNLELIVYSACFCLMASSLLFALIWIPRKIFGRMKNEKYLSVRVIPLLAVCTYILYFIVIMSSSDLFHDMGNITFISVSAFILSIVFAVLSLAGLLVGIYSFKWQMNRLVRIHSLLVSAGLTTWTIYLWYWGFIGWRSWA
jgi:CubicO group peptidase (beta-lactamase class C family)